MPIRQLSIEARGTKLPKLTGVTGVYLAAILSAMLTFKDRHTLT